MAESNTTAAAVAEARASLDEFQRAEARARGLAREVDNERKIHDALVARFADELHDVEQLEGWTLTRLLASIRGRREELIHEERNEAEAVRLEVVIHDEVRNRLHEEQQAADKAAAGLPRAQEDLRRALVAHEAASIAAGTPVGIEVRSLIDRTARLSSQLGETQEAAAAAATASTLIQRAYESLSSAGSWSTYDTFFGGGFFSSMIKHDKLDAAAADITQIHHALTRLRAELADIGADTDLTVDLPSATLRGLDIWFDNIFSDWMVDSRIRASRDAVGAANTKVAQLRRDLITRVSALERLIKNLDTERQTLLGG